MVMFGAAGQGVIASPAGSGSSPGAGAPGGGFEAKLNTRMPLPVVGASTPFGLPRSSPAFVLLPDVVLAPSVIHPLLLKVYGASFPISVSIVRATFVPCVPRFGSIGPGVSGAGLSCAFKALVVFDHTLYVTDCVWSLTMFSRRSRVPV